MATHAPDQDKRSEVGPGETLRARAQPYLVPGLLSIIGLLLAGWLTFMTVSFGGRIDDVKGAIDDAKRELRRELGGVERQVNEVKGRMDRLDDRLTHQERIRMSPAPSN